MSTVTKPIRGRRRIIAGFSLLAAGFALCFPPVTAAQQGRDVEVIETEVGFDQLLEDSIPDDKKLEDITFEEQQIKQINASLKNLIEENRKLIERNKDAGKALGELRGQQEIRANRIRTLTRQREELQEKVQSKTAKTEQYEQELKALKAMLQVQEEEFEKKVRQLEAQLEMEEGWKQEIEEATSGRSTPRTYVINDSNRSSLRYLERENEALKNDAAKVHYNLGNVHFRQGQYKKAAEEYQRAVELIPYDAEAHYNLAFVLGEYLGDPRNALKHYQQYLYLRPDAEDTLLVKEKITQARLKLRTIIDSHLDRDDSAKKAKKNNKIKPELVLE